MLTWLVFTIVLVSATQTGRSETEIIQDDNLLDHVILRRDTSRQSAPLPYTDHEHAPLPNTQREEGSSGTQYSSGTVQSRFHTRVGVAESNDEQDYDRRRERLEAERRRRQHQIELDRRNREIAEAEARRNQGRRQPTYSSGESTSTSQSGGEDQGSRRGTFYTETSYSGSGSTSGTSAGGSNPVYGNNGQQGTRQTYYTSSGTYVPSRGGYIPSGGSYVPVTGSNVPSSGSTGGGGTFTSSGTYIPGRTYSQGTYVTSGGAYVPRGGGGGSSGRYVPSSGSYVPSGGSYVPSGGSYVPSGGSYVPSGGSYVPSGSGTYISGSGSYVPSGGTYVPSGGTYVPQQSIPRYAPNPLYDSVCPQTGVRLRINGLDCTQAINQYGSSLCYRHEFTSRECCDRCQPLKNPIKRGCEYGDHSYQCRQLQKFDCYDLRHSLRCCESCQRMRTGEPGCEYGDMTPRCQQVRENPTLCYVPDNANFCCETCATLKDTSKPDCGWGDRNSNLCQAYTPGGEVRVNCYSPSIARLCCETCERIKSRYSGHSIPGCEYGDHPVVFNAIGFGSLNCTAYIRQFSVEQCTTNQVVAENCCFTCRRYQQG